MNNQASQMAENVVVLNEMQMTLQYCRSMITAKRTSHQLLADEIRQHQRESQVKQMRNFFFRKRNLTQKQTNGSSVFLKLIFEFFSKIFEKYFLA